MLCMLRHSCLSAAPYKAERCALLYIFSLLSTFLKDELRVNALSPESLTRRWSKDQQCNLLRADQIHSIRMVSACCLLVCRIIRSYTMNWRFSFARSSHGRDRWRRSSRAFDALYLKRAYEEAESRTSSSQYGSSEAM